MLIVAVLLGIFLIQAAWSHQITRCSLLALGVLLVGGELLAAYAMKIIVLNRTLEHNVTERTRQLRDEKRKVEATNAELTQILETGTGGLRVMGLDRQILRVNQTFRDMVGMDDAEIFAKPCYESFSGPCCHTEHCSLNRILQGAQRVEEEIDIVCKNGRVVHCLLTATPWRSPDGELLGFIENFTDVSAIRTLTTQQTINIGLAQRVLSFINATHQRYADLDESTSLFMKVLAYTCHMAGGDHYFMRQLPPDANHPAGRTVISLKDQSGHEVNCVLKSIVTDLIHNAILHSTMYPTLEDEIRRLNRDLVQSSLFAGDEFVTAITIEIDHATRMLRYISCGHPPFLMVRGREILSFPQDTGPGRHLPLVVHPDIEFHAGQIEMERGDRLVLYTDGLTEMSVSQMRRKITTPMLGRIIERILAREPDLPVSQLIRKILDLVAEISAERIGPEAENTSADDVTVIGLELESQAADVEKELHITSVTDLSERIIELTERIGADAQEKDFALDKWRLRSVLDEALTNAWKHGNGCDPAKPITLRWRFGNDAQIEIVDRGPGFDYRHLEDPTEGQNLTRTSGRGLFMIRLCADHIRWKDGGRRIILSFYRPAEEDRRQKRRLQRTNYLNIWHREPHLT